VCNASELVAPLLDKTVIFFFQVSVSFHFFTTNNNNNNKEEEDSELKSSWFSFADVISDELHHRSNGHSGHSRGHVRRFSFGGQCSSFHTKKK
jgi:hypothetical protein